MRRFWDWLRRQRYATGGEVGPAAPTDDRVAGIVHPGYVSFDGGKTWHQCDAPLVTCIREHREK